MSLESHTSHFSNLDPGHQAKEVNIKMPSMRITKLELKKEYPCKEDSVRAAKEYINSFIEKTQSSKYSIKEKKVLQSVGETLKGMRGEFSMRIYCIYRTVQSKLRKIVDQFTLDDDDAADTVDDDASDDASDESADAATQTNHSFEAIHEDILLFLTTNIPQSTSETTSYRPEIYALTSGHAHRFLKENMCDREFPIKCAKRVLKFNLKALSSKQLTGPLSSKTESYKPGGSTMVTFWDSLGQITTSYKMPLRDDASLYRRCLRTKTGTPRRASMTVGETYLRMSPEMSLKDIALLLYQLSRIARGEKSRKYQSKEKEIDDKAFDVLNQVKIETNKRTINTLNQILMKKIIVHVKGKSKNLGLYLSNQDLKGWEDANRFVLKIKMPDKRKLQILQEWEGQPPNLVELLHVVKDKDEIKRLLQTEDYSRLIDSLSLHFCGSHKGIYHKDPLLKYIHGHIRTRRGESVFRFGGKWLRIENEYMVNLEEQFRNVEQYTSLDDNVLVLPWQYSGKDCPKAAAVKDKGRKERPPTSFTGRTFRKWMKQTFKKKVRSRDYEIPPNLNPSKNVQFDVYLENEDEKVIEKQLFLRMHCQQAEEHYNEGYILYDQLLTDYTSGYLLGDRIFIFGQNIELYDILFYTPQKTYLIHVKEGFGNTTRDVCSQIRNSAEVVFKHLISNNSFDILKKYWSSVTGYKGTEKYRQVVRDRYLEMEKEKFIQLFNREEIVYVLAYRDTKKTPSTMVPFVPYPKERLTHEFRGKTDEVVEELLRCKYLRRDGAGRICLTDKVFNTLEQAKKEIRLETLAMAKKAFNILRETMSNHSSFIAKMEVVHLYSNFKRFVTPSKQLSLKMCSIRKNVLTQD
ncbi:uncharacterized protein LOC124145912 [Haliotis rufescens]|uniref:uncharacterized protein LOC124145912 n=1 Tax=Haliotis rufescens TaxID=6454 RepID=UPI00201F1B7B|nr:uncharacterized protein LOC124145912 [Haliotis rufescens]